MRWPMSTVLSTTPMDRCSVTRKQNARFAGFSGGAFGGLIVPRKLQALSNIPASSTRERNSFLAERVILGDGAAREELITSNMRLVVTLVDAWIRNHPTSEFMRDD